MVKNNLKYLKITMPLILLLTMIAIFFYYNAQENIKGFYKTRGFQGKVQITGIGWADKITYCMNKEDEVKHYLIFHIDYQETINNKKEHVKTQLPLHIQDLLYPYIASPTEATQILIAKIVNIRFYLMKENMGTTLLKSLLKSTLEIKNLSMISLKL